MKRFKQITEEVLNEGGEMYPADEMTISELKIACYSAQNILDRLEDGAMIQRWQISAIVKAKEELAAVYTAMSADEDDEWEDEMEDEEPMYVGFEYPSMYGEEVELDEAVDKDHPIVKEYHALKKNDIKTLRNMIAGQRRISDVSEFRSKDHAVSAILRDKYGHKKVDKAFGFNEEVELDEQIKGWKNAGRDLAKWRAAQGKDVKLVSLKKDGTESKMNDASKMFRSEDEAQEHHKRVTELNPKSKIRHNLYVDGKHVKTLGESVELGEGLFGGGKKIEDHHYTLVNTNVNKRVGHGTVWKTEAGAKTYQQGRGPDWQGDHMKVMTVGDAKKRGVPEHNFHNLAVSEEVELDEVSDDLKKRYIEKGGEDVYNRFTGRGKYEKPRDPSKFTKTGRPKKSALNSPESIKYREKLANRRDIINKVSQQVLGKNRFEEEVEQIDELSNTTLQRYKSGANKVIDKSNDSDEIKKRGKGYALASKKLTARVLNKEEVELDEISYRDSGARNMLKADQKAEREVAKMRAQAAKEAAKKKPVEEETDYEVDVEGLPKMYVKADSPSEVKNNLRKVVKNPEMIRSVDRVTQSVLQKIFRDKASGKEE